MKVRALVALKFGGTRYAEGDIFDAGAHAPVLTAAGIAEELPKPKKPRVRKKAATKKAKGG